MGCVAASGGYYVSMGATRSSPTPRRSPPRSASWAASSPPPTCGTTIGITWDSNRRGANAGLFSSDAVFSDAERKKVQTWMNDVYGVFKGHVVAARGAKLKKPIDELAAGRVFTGQQALELGLVDEIGSLEDAIRDAAKQREDQGLRGPHLSRAQELPGAPRRGPLRRRARPEPPLAAALGARRRPADVDPRPGPAAPQGARPRPAGDGQSGLAAARLARPGARRDDDAGNQHPGLSELEPSDTRRNALEFGPK